VQSDAMIEWGLDLDSQTKEVVPFGLEKNTSVFFFRRNLGISSKID